MVDAGARHRLLAILAADAVGYSRLMASDETAALTALDAAREVFRSQTTFNQGRIVDTAGDSVLAVFETATGAVTAALAIQAEINASAGTFPDDRQMRFRIGVHLGDVIEKTDGTVYGDGVNIAARLQCLAEPGGVTVSESIQVAVRGRIAATFVDIGQQQSRTSRSPSVLTGLPSVLLPPVLTGRRTAMPCTTSLRSRYCPSRTWAATRTRSTSATG